MTDEPTRQAPQKAGPGAAFDRRWRDALRTGPFSLAFQLSRERSGLTLQALSGRLDRRGIRVSTSTLSAWEKGHNNPERARSLEAVRALEDIWRLPRNTLVRLLAPSRRRPSAKLPTSASGIPSPEFYEELYEQAGGIPPQRVLDDHEFHYVGADGMPHLHRSRLVVEATEDGLNRYLVVAGSTRRARPPEVRGVENCRRGRTWEHPAGLFAFELLFDTSLRRGETHLFEFETVLTHVEDPEPWFRRYPFEQLRQFVLQVTFDEERLPTRVFRCMWDSFGGPPIDLEELHLDRQRSVHVVEISPPANTPRGIRWEW